MILEGANVKLRSCGLPPQPPEIVGGHTMKAIRTLLVALLTLAATTAIAETGTYFNNDTYYSAWIHGMPHLDQQRQSPLWEPSRQEGAMYCGPTTATNVLNYLAREGYPDVQMSSSDLEPVDRDDRRAHAR